MKLLSDKIKLNYLMLLIDVIRKTNDTSCEIIKSQYLIYAKEYDLHVEFAIEVNIILLSSNKILFTDEFSRILSGYSSIDQINLFIIDSLFNYNSIYKKELKTLLSAFIFVNNIWSCNLTLEQRIEHAGLRNILIELNIIEYNQQLNLYILHSFAFNYIENITNTLKINRQQYENIVKQKTELGYNAELEIIRYERQRLSQYPNLAESIIHVSEIDVGAGYDIRSFELINNRIEIRYIEVKAVRYPDYKFYWSDNEVNTSMELSNQYYLYLLPVITIKTFDILKLKIINNPYINVFENSTIWLNNIESMSFWLKK